MVRKQQRPKRRRRRLEPDPEPARAPCPDFPEKTPYRSEKAAHVAIRKAEELATPGQDVPRRAYECPGCFLFHLSKLEEWEDGDGTGGG